MDDLLSKPARRDRHLTAVEYVVEQVTEAIRRTTYKPGQRLVEAELIRSLSVSRSSVREAMRQLATAGLVQVERNKGARVREMSRNEILDLIQVRSVLEGLAAGLAAARVEPGSSQEELKSIVAQMEKSESSRKWDAYHRQNQAFHNLILHMSGNEELIRLVNQLPINTLRVQFYYRLSRFAQTKKSMTDHRNIYDAILNGDSIGAEKAMRAHVAQTIEWILGNPKDLFSDA